MALGGFALFFFSSDALFAQRRPQSPKEKSLFTTTSAFEKVRVGVFHEYFSKAAQSRGVPLSNGKALGPSQVNGRVSAEYAWTARHRIFYWQRYTVREGNFSDSSQKPLRFGNATPLGNVTTFSWTDPRIGYRAMDIFSTTDKTNRGLRSFNPLIAHVDLYFMPKLYSQDPDQQKKNLEFGTRITMTHAILRSHWTIGMNSEINYRQYTRFMKPSRFSGSLVSWATYQLLQSLSTIHSFVTLYRISNSKVTLSPQDKPFVSNGLRFKLLKDLILTSALNNYATVKPTLANSWLTLGVQLSLL